MSDIGMIKLKKNIVAFIKKKGYREVIVETFKGGEENGEIFIEGEVISSRSFEKLSSLFSFLEKIKASKAYFGENAIFILSMEGEVYVIHGLSVRNFI